jgi:hypothetical protein
MTDIFRKDKTTEMMANFLKGKLGGGRTEYPFVV